jgi:hypothetical protein
VREQLKNIKGFRYRFTALFVRFGKKTVFKGPSVKTLLFENIRDKYGNEYCDHIWFTTNKQFEALNLQPGDGVSFDARVKEYWKGYKGRREDDDLPPVEKDYKLSHPNNIVKTTAGKQPGTLF